MPQQINLYTPILLTQKRYFSAQTMAVAIGVFVLLGAPLLGFWVWTLHSASDEISRTLAAQAHERETLTATLQNLQPGGDAASAELTQQLQVKQTELAQRERLLKEVSRGMMIAGQGQSARMRLVAQTIPPQAWLTDMVADEQGLEVRGYTYDTAALNGWVTRLGSSDILKGQRLSAVTIERPDPASVPRADGAASAADRPVWRFTLVSAAPGSKRPDAGGGARS